MHTYQILPKSDQQFRIYWPLKFRIIAKSGGSAQFLNAISQQPLGRFW